MLFPPRESRLAFISAGSLVVRGVHCHCRVFGVMPHFREPCYPVPTMTYRVTPQAAATAETA